MKEIPIIKQARHQYRLAKINIDKKYKQLVNFAYKMVNNTFKML